MDSYIDADGDYIDEDGDPDHRAYYKGSAEHTTAAIGRPDIAPDFPLFNRALNARIATRRRGPG